MVDVEVDAQDALVGTVALEGADVWPFHGWIGLFAALEGSVERVRGGGVGDLSSPTGGT